MKLVTSLAICRSKKTDIEIRAIHIQFRRLSVLNHLNNSNTVLKNSGLELETYVFKSSGCLSSFCRSSESIWRQISNTNSVGSVDVYLRKKYSPSNLVRLVRTKKG